MSGVKTIAIKDTTYYCLQKIKVANKLKTFDDVIEFLINNSSLSYVKGELRNNNNEGINVGLGENRIDEKIRIACYELYKQSKSKEVMFYLPLLKQLHIKKKITLTNTELEYINQNSDVYVNCFTYLKDLNE